MPSHRFPDLKIDRFEGPLDLLFHLIEKNDIDIYDIPIAEITDQYMSYLHGMSAPDMEAASEFLVMAATLIHIKTKMMLPGIRAGAAVEDGEDPREELVIRLLQYRRCKILAQDLRERYAYHSDSILRLPSLPKTLGITVQSVPQEFDPDCFNRSIMAVCSRNEIRFADISSKITHLLKREKVSIRDKMRIVWQRLTEKGRAFFHEIFPATETTPTEKVAGFLAVLELLRSNRISAEQERPYDVILLSKKEDRSRKDSRMYMKQPHRIQKENQA
ncbi:MAG: segregation/condensation protein A [Clostridiaceae bacterium]|jgi:segregation and condensation protein A|nr:segregation/condensation protein A [Oscillospiraceae bacterium]NLO62002.1 segregation/condensation protein A [Clostridiaceae bacterium]